MEALLEPGSIERAVQARWPSRKHAEMALRLQRHARGAAVRGSLLKMGARRARLCPPVWKGLQAHQLRGQRWLAASIAENGGAILADDPGLGKTLTAIGFMEALVRAQLVTRVLVVVPANLLKVWENELGRWLGKQAHRLEVDSLAPDVASLHASHKLKNLCAVPPPPTRRHAPPPPPPPPAAAALRELEPPFSGRFRANPRIRGSKVIRGSISARFRASLEIELDNSVRGRSPFEPRFVTF